MEKYTSQFTGPEIDARLQEVASKYGHIEMRFDEQQTMYYMDCYATKDDIENGVDPIESVLIPISTVQGDSFTASLRTSLNSDANIVVSGGKLEVPLNYRSIKISQLGNENAGFTGTLIIQTSTDGSTWNTMGEIPNVLTPREIDDQNTYQMVDIGEYLVQGRQMVRVRASYTYTNENNEEKTVTSGNVLVGTSVTKTQLKLELATEYHMPMKTTDVNGNVQPFNVTYRIFGSVQKTLFMKIDGGSELKYEYSSSVDSVPQTVQASGNQYLTHGVHKVEAWLQCEDGLGGTITSEKLVNRFMMVADTSNTKPYLLLQNVDGMIDNFVQTEVAEYAVYAPNQEKVNVAFLLTTYTTDYETNKPSEYFRLEQQVVPQTPNQLLTTVEIEAENDAQSQPTYNTYFRVRRMDGTTETDFMKESTGDTSYLVIVDNTNAMTPVSGATFLINPKIRNNNEANPKTILNAKNNNAVVPSVWTNIGLINDGWMTDDEGNKVLRIMAGGQLEIKKDVWAQFRTNPNSSLTIEIDCKISNVTNTTDPIIQMFSGTASTFRGLKMNALEGWLKNGSEQSSDDTLFAWQEDVRTHFSFNLNHQVFPNKGDVKYADTDAAKANGSIALARVLVNGDCVRELKYDTTKIDEWSSSDNGSIIIGNEGADIDIYSIRIYENKQLDTIDILTRNYLASLPKADDKLALKQKNDLLDGGLISVEKTKNAKLNTMIWHGILPYKNESSDQTGWLEIYRYDAEGNYLPGLSGTICKQTKSLGAKGQGSTAKTYYDWNVQDDSSKVKETIQVALKDFHESISVRIEGDQAYIKGGNLGKNFPLEETEVAYPYANGMVTVPDGWIDGNGKYRGMGYMVAYGTALAQKRVIKINYASSMQSHLIGACKTYDLLHRKVVGDTPLQGHVPSSVAAKHTEPFMYFNQEGNGNVYFKGMGTYGAGKADKVAWGFVKKEMPMYALIEGSDNNLPMTGFRVPFDKNTAVYDCDGEGWLYNGVQNFDFDLGATETFSDATQTGEGWQFVNTGKNDGKVPSKAIRDKWADIHNFIYLNSTNLKFFDGTFEQFKQSSAAQDANYKYWCTQGSEAFYLKRYDFIEKQWVDAGLSLGSGGYDADILSEYSVTSSAYREWLAEGSGDYNQLNELFKEAHISHMKSYLNYFINEKSLQFNYCYVLGFLAGTDNSDKNTYYKIMPYAATVKEDSQFSRWFKSRFYKDFDYSACHQLYFDGDDMDSIFRTDNNSHLTKPYYIDRLHPYADEKPNDSLYEGMGNQLFNYVEKAYEDTNELASVMNQIMIAATELIDESDTKDNKLVGGKSLWGFLNKYFFNIQRYFPQIAYLEQARIRYEFPELIGYISSGGGARSIRPITQSLGSQLQSELQYMNQRVIYMTSYAGFGAWGGDTTHSIGLADANETFGFMPANMPDGSGATYTFTIQPHQYIYPSYYLGQTFTQTHKRTSPKETCTFTIAENLKDGGDTGMGICGINYISDLGNLGNISVTSAVTINGKRLMRLCIESNQFRSESVVVNSLNIKEFRRTNASGVSFLLDLTKQIRLEKINDATGLIKILFPQSHNLKEIGLLITIAEGVELKNMPNLKTLKITLAYWFSSYSVFTDFIVGENVGSNTELSIQGIIEQMNSLKHKFTALETLIVKNIGNPTEGKGWSDLDANVMEWLSEIPTCELKGTISIKEDDPYGNPRITWDLKNKILGKFGNVDTGAKGLTLTYKQRAFDATQARVKGNFYVEAGNTFQFEVRPNSIYENSQLTIEYYARYGTYCSIDKKTGVLTIKKLSDTKQTEDVIVYVTYFNEGTWKDVTFTKTIEIWNRPAQVGDLVYADGTFSSAESWDGDKTPIGVCFHVGLDDGTGTYTNPNDTQKRLMVSLDDVSVPVDGVNETLLQWGAQPPSQGDEWDNSYALFDRDDRNNFVILTSSNVLVDSVYNISSIADLSSGGLNSNYIDPDPTTNAAGKESDYRSSDDEALMYNYGFKLCTPDTAIGDGFSYRENETAYNTYLTARTLDEDLARLAGNGYKAGDIVNSAYAKTLKVIQHRNRILQSDIMGADANTPLIAAEKFQIPYASSDKTELVSLGETMSNMRKWAKDTHGETEGNAKKWSQLCYPFASACYAYQPEYKLKSGEVLADKFKAHNWFAPTEGLLARICWLVMYGQKNEYDLFKEARDKGLLRFSTSSYYWGVTEYSIYSGWFVLFANGGTYYNPKTYGQIGRAVTSF